MAETNPSLQNAPEFGADISYIPVDERAAALTLWDSVAGWLPRRGNSEELQQYCTTVTDRLSSLSDMNIDDPDVASAIADGIVRQLDAIYVEIDGKPFN